MDEYGEIVGVEDSGEVEDEEIGCHHEDVAVLAVTLSQHSITPLCKMG